MYIHTHTYTHACTFTCACTCTRTCTCTCTCTCTAPGRERRTTASGRDTIRTHEGIYIRHRIQKPIGFPPYIRWRHSARAVVPRRGARRIFFPTIHDHLLYAAHTQSNRPVLLGPTVEVGPGSVSPGHARLEGHYTLTHAICMMARAGRGGPVSP